MLLNLILNIGDQAYAGNATQNIHPSLIQKTRIHIQLHTLHHSYIYKLKIHEKHTQSKNEDRSTALARSVAVIYYWGLKPVYVHTTSLLSSLRLFVYAL